MDKNTSSPNSTLKLLTTNILYIGLAIGLAALVQAFIIRPFIVSGNSMDPIIENKEYLIIDEVSYRTRQPRRGEVIVFRSPPEPKKYYIKRIIGLPGDTVTIDNKKITISNKDHPDGFVLDESFIVHHKQGNSLSTPVPENSYFVMGDNRDASYDSRNWGPLPKEAIRGRVLLRLLPLSKIDYLPGNQTYEETN